MTAFSLADLFEIGGHMIMGCASSRSVWSTQDSRPSPRRRSTRCRTVAVVATQAVVKAGLRVRG